MITEDYIDIYQAAANNLIGKPVILRFWYPYVSKTNGVFYKNEHGQLCIDLTPGRSISEVYTTLIHECGHAVLDHPVQRLTPEKLVEATIKLQGYTKSDIELFEDPADTLAKRWDEWASKEAEKLFKPDDEYSMRIIKKLICLEYYHSKG